MARFVSKQILIFTLLAMPLLSFGYTETTSGGQLSARVDPENPGPLTGTTISLVSYQVDVGKSNITWTINGKVASRGIGLNSLQFLTGDLGKKTVVVVEVVSQDGSDIKKTISFVPAEVDIVWQSDGYVPPFYRGKALPAVGDDVTLLAEPNFVSQGGTRIDPSKLVYSWSADSVDIGSGYGKISAISTVSRPSVPTNFFVDVSTVDGTMRATRSLPLKPSDPKLLFYETEPLIGTIYENSLLGNFKMKSAETTIRAVPYFLSPKELSYSWDMNGGAMTPTKDNSGEITLRRPGGGSGEALLGVMAASKRQSVQNSITIGFGQTAGF